MDSPVCVAFTDFESGFKPQNHILGLILKERLGAVFVDDLARADLLIYQSLEMPHVPLKVLVCFIRKNLFCRAGRKDAIP